jgi:hypothetical protein
MATRIDESERQPNPAGTDRLTVAEVATERALVRAIVKSLLVSIPLMIAFWVLLVAVAVHGRDGAMRGEDVDWASWLGMAAVIGVLAGVFFGAWMGFVAKAHALDEIDERSNHPLPQDARSRDNSGPPLRTSDLVPEWPQGAGVAPPHHQRIEDIEGERLLENEARARMRDEGFTDAQILSWVEAYFAERHEGNVDELVNWIRERERTVRRRDLETGSR